jgi:hypothetical protein
MESKHKTKKCSSISKAKSASKFNLEEIVDEALLEPIIVKFKSRSGLLHGEDGLLDTRKNDVTEFSEQCDKDLADKSKGKVTNEIDKTLATGFSKLNFFMKKLKKLCKYRYLKFYRSF